MKAPVLVALSVLAACSFEHGRLPERAGGDATTNDAAAVSDARAIDAAPPIDARVCPAAPSGCTLFECESSSSCYYLCGSATSSTGKANWAGAVGSCENANLGCIVTIDDQAEQDCIALATLPAFPNALVWFGYHQSAQGSEPAGDWAWQCGTSSYVSPAWGAFEPNNDGNEDCALLTSFGGWNDADCTGNARYVCELP